MMRITPRDLVRSVPDRVLSMVASAALGLALIRYAAARRAASERRP